MEQFFWALDSSFSANERKAAVEKHEETIFIVKLSLNREHFQSFQESPWDSLRERRRQDSSLEFLNRLHQQ